MKRIGFYLLAGTVYLFDHALAWLLDKLGRLFGPWFPPTGTMSKDYRKQRRYLDEQEKLYQKNGQQP